MMIYTGTIFCCIIRRKQTIWINKNLFMNEKKNKARELNNWTMVIELYDRGIKSIRIM